MNIGVLAETGALEHRIAIVPSTTSKLCGLGHTVLIESGAGLKAGHTDEAYIAAGASCVSRQQVLLNAQCILHVSVPTVSDIAELKAGTTLISNVYPRRHPDIVAQLASSLINVFAIDCLPRITRAQSMDVLSSQNNLAGYKAVILGASQMPKIFPLMMTAAGTVPPAKVLIFGAGVAGLQAVATARRLGAQVEVTDIRPETREQVESLGARFIMVDGLDTVDVQGGYVAAVDEEVLARQKQAVEKSLMQADLVVTTALVAGGKAPTLITAEQVSRMKRGAVIVDMAADAGGNCERTRADERIDADGVLILGPTDLASSVAQTSSELFAKNILTFIQHVSTQDGFAFDVTDEITTATLIVLNGQVRI